MSARVFTIYSLSTGAILRTGYCQPEAIDLQANEGEGLLKDVMGDRIEQHVIQPVASAPYLRRRAQEEIDAALARRAPPAPSVAMSALLDKLVAKGLLTANDIDDLKGAP